MSRVMLGKKEHWLVLAVSAFVLFAMGTQHLHVRDFVAFVLVLTLTVAVGLGFIVWRHRPGDEVTREPIEDSPPGSEEEATKAAGGSGDA